MKSLVTLLLTAVLSAVSNAQSSPNVPSAEFADAEVRKIDKDSSKITLKHGEIKSLDMPPMTMVFKVKEAALLDKAKVGDKVRFKAIKDGWSYAVIEMELAK